MPKIIQSALQARQSDQKCIQEGVPSLVLMEKAAMGIADFLLSHPEWQQVAVVCGPGNNGADGLAAARLLQEAGRQTTAWIPAGKTSPDFQVQKQAALCAGVHLLPLGDLPQGDSWRQHADVIVDAMFGSGLSRGLQDAYASAAASINASGLPVVAVDLASGLDGNTGKALGPTVHACFTISLDTLKEGHIRNDGPACSGTVIVKDIGIADRYHAHSFFLLNAELAASLLARRPENAHKGTFGRVLLCGGSLPMQGALNMAANACFRAGCGLLTLYTPRPAAKAIAAKNDLAMILSAASNRGFFALDACVPIPDMVKNYDVFACGNGMGKGKGARLVLETLMQQEIPLLVDADGLNCLAKNRALLQRTAPTILTPHVKEFSRLSGLDTAAILADPVGCARAFLKTYPNVTLVLKGAQTLVADHEKMAWLDHPHSALAKGGSGDVLAGLITGLWAWNKDPFAAACIGVYVHNAASWTDPDLCPICFTPNQLIEHFPQVFNQLMDLQDAAPAGSIKGAD